MKIIFEMDVKEKWKKVKDYPYKVSNFGRVKRIKKGMGATVGKILKPGVDRYGYLIVRLYRNRKGKTIKIHKLVTEAFLGPCPRNKQVNHKDGNKQNPYLDNLEYVTPSENMKHSFKLGLQNHKGENNPKSRLKEKDVLKIRRLHRIEKYTQEKISKIFNISFQHVSDIVKNKYWKHIL